MQDFLPTKIVSLTKGYFKIIQHCKGINNGAALIKVLKKVPHHQRIYLRLRTFSMSVHEFNCNKRKFTCFIKKLPLQAFFAVDIPKYIIKLYFRVTAMGGVFKY